jgi:3-hydroxyacyl-[acyl-carrier-protein] dehydratase
MAADSTSGEDDLVALLPHRPPMRLLDSAVWIDDGDRLLARQRIPLEHPVLNGHFPDWPVWPGALLIEAMAQTTAVWLIRRRGALGPGEVPLLGAVDCNFLRPLRPGASVRFETRCVRRSEDLGLFVVTATLDSGDVVARARISAGIRPLASMTQAG